MKTKLKAKWVAALRSGNFKQGQYKLRDSNNYCCCLGVLADIMGVNWKPLSNYYSCEFQPRPYVNKLNFEALKTIGITNGDQETLIRMNDCGENFKTIADYIEEFL